MKILIASIVALGSLTMPGYSQLNTSKLKLCLFSTPDSSKAAQICPNVQFHAFRTNDGIEKLVNKITAIIGLKPNFILIPCPDIKNCAALLYEDNIRYIIYDKPFMDDIAKTVKTNWSNMMILAHEIGHHLNGHTLRRSNKEESRNEELEADEFAGFILGKMGATLLQAVAAMDGIPHPACDIEYFSDHPCKVKRVQAIKTGWSKATGTKYIVSAKQKAAQQKPIPVKKSILNGNWYTELDNERGTDGFIPLILSFTNDSTIHYRFYNQKGDSVIDQYDSYYKLEKGILYEKLPYGAAAKAKVQMLSNRAFLLEIIDNGTEGFQGLKRVYAKLKDE